MCRKPTQVQFIYLTNLIFSLNSAHLVHEKVQRIIYRIEFRTIIELVRSLSALPTLSFVFVARFSPPPLLSMFCSLFLFMSYVAMKN